MARESLGEGLRRGSEEIHRFPREGRRHLHPKRAARKPHPLVPRDEGRVQREWDVSMGPLPRLPVRV